MLERHNGLDPDPDGAFTYYDQAQATIADLQGQVKAAYKTLSDGALEKAELGTQLAALQQRVAQLEGENKALVDAHRDFKVHLSHCNFGEHAQVCKYGREETCPALMPSWAWFGNALQRSEALCLSHATLLGLVQALPVVPKEYLTDDFVHLGVPVTATLWAQIGPDLIALLTYRASLPAQRAKPAQGKALIDRMAHINDGCECRICKPAQGGAVSKPVTTCNRHSDCDAADEKARAKGALNADHCHDDCCSECFGN